MIFSPIRQLQIGQEIYQVTHRQKYTALKNERNRTRYSYQQFPGLPLWKLRVWVSPALLQFRQPILFFLKKKSLTNSLNRLLVRLVCQIASCSVLSDKIVYDVDDLLTLWTLDLIIHGRLIPPCWHSLRMMQCSFTHIHQPLITYGTFHRGFDWHKQRFLSFCKLFCLQCL